MVDDYDPDIEAKACYNLTKVANGAPYKMYFENKPQMRRFEVTIHVGGGRFDFEISHKDAVSVTWADIVGHQ